MKRLNAKRSHVAEMLKSHATDFAQGRLSVSELMTPSPLSIDPATNMLEILRIFHKNQVHHLLVLDSDGRLLGIVSERDVLRCFSPGLRPSEKYLTGITAADVLSSDLITGQRTATPDTSLVDAVGEMTSLGIDCLPIMQDEKPVGILTSTDLNIVLEELLRFYSARASVPEIASAI